MTGRAPGVVGIRRAVAAGLECRAGPGSTAGRRSAFMEVRDYIEDNAEGFFEALKEWLAIPSICAAPDHHGDVRASAEWLAARLRGTGFPVVEIWETGAVADHGEPRERIGQSQPRERSEQSQPRERSEQSQPGLPAVFAHWPAADPGVPTVLVYGHHDVQPVEPLSEWHS